tara:strand:- start:209 stop:1258 length:1050 start_codon:yes stop_codon:yes gene_type:complete
MRIALIIALTILTSSFLSAQTKQDSILAIITNDIDSMPEGFAISIALLNNDSTTFVGFSKSNTILTQVTNKDSLFEIGSITKVFTSTVLAHHIISHKIKPNTPINKVFPFKFNNKTKLTYLSLSNHTSGMHRLPSNILPLLYKNPTNPYKDYSYELLDNYLKEDLQLINKAQYSYSNLGAGVLAYALAKKNKTSFETLLKATVLDKYKMSSTSYNFNVSYFGIGADNNKTENWQMNSLIGAGGLISNTNDLSTFIHAQFDTENKELALTRKETFSINDNFSIGLGWHIFDSNTKNEKFWHNGGTGGYTSSISFRTTNNTGVIILSNISPLHKNSSKIDELCFKLLELLK